MAPISRTLPWAATLRARAATSAHTSTRRGRQAFNRSGRRGYSDHAHDAPTGFTLRGDLPWIIGATGVTVPVVYYLLQPGKETGHGHGHGHGHEETVEHHEDAEEKEKEGGDGEGDEKAEGGEGEMGGKEKEEGGEETEGAKDDGEETEGAQDDSEAESKDEGKEESKSDDTGDVDDNETGTESEGKDEADKRKEKADTEGKDVEKEGTNAMEINPEDKELEERAGTKENPKIVDDDREDNNRKVSYKDAKGGIKMRLESKNAIPQGGDDDADGGDGKDNVSGPAGDSHHSHSGAQEGISNTATKHSTDVRGNPDMSTKAEGDAETAKIKGPVSVNRPAK